MKRLLLAGLIAMGALLAAPAMAQDHPVHPIVHRPAVHHRVVHHRRPPPRHVYHHPVVHHPVHN